MCYTFMYNKKNQNICMNELQMKIFDQNNLIKFGASSEENLSYLAVWVSHFMLNCAGIVGTTTTLVLCKTQITAEYCDFDMKIKCWTNKDDE